jgi:L-threonylcarbamoyladenylate synthase
MKILKVNETNQTKIIDEIVKSLSRGELIIFPTETTYGAGVDATNQAAVNKLLSYKTRREGKPLSIAVPDIYLASQYVELNDTAKKFYETFLPGPFTIISLSKHKTALGVESEFGTLGVRIPAYELVLDFLRAFAKPVTATSANVSGKKSPYSIEDLLTHLSEKQKSLIDLVIDAGELPKNKPSTIIDTTLSAPVALRQGDLVADGVARIEDQPVDFVSSSEQETKDIAKRLLLKNWKQIKTKGMIIGLDGELGVGKTVFTKGIAEFLQIKDTITSPTYNYVNEYDFERHEVEGKLFHFDVWKVSSKEELARLDFFKILKPNHVIVIEWWQQISGFVSDLNIGLVEVRLSENNNGERELRVSQK